MLRAQVRNLDSLPRFHRSFLIDAIRSNAEFLITERKVWLRNSDQIARAYGVRIVSPGRFIRQATV